MAQEESFWRHKSRKDWILHMDSYYFLSPKNYFTKKLLLIAEEIELRPLRIIWGIGFTMRNICSHTVGYFFTLFKSEAHFYQAYHVSNFFPAFNANYLDCVTDPIVDEEIKKGIFSIKPLKAPSIDGFHAIFYQSQWHIIGPSFGKFITDIFNTGKIPQNVNKTMLVLIPKVDHPTNLKMFQPIRQ